MQTPKIHSGPHETWAPANLVSLDNKLFFVGLRGQSLYQAEISTNNTIQSVTPYLSKQFGRLRAIKLGPDGFLYISTSNTDGRGNPTTGDDKIIKIHPNSLEAS